MYTYPLILNTHEFIDKIPEKLQGEKRAKMSKKSFKMRVLFCRRNFRRAGRRVKTEKRGEIFEILIFSFSIFVLVFFVVLVF